MLCIKLFVDLFFLRTLAAGRLPRPVPVGPALELVIDYQNAGLIDAEIPPRVGSQPSVPSMLEGSAVTAVGIVWEVGI